MTFLNIVLLQVLLLAIGQAQQTAQYPVSNCLGNCQTCDPKNPTVCLEGIDNSTGKITRCVPFYEGPECLLGGSYYVHVLLVRIFILKTEFSTTSSTGQFLPNLKDSNATQ